MIPFGSNLFCQPSPLLEPLAQDSALLEWSADGVTFQAVPAPGATQVYLRVTADFDFTDATSMSLAEGAGGYGPFAAVGSAGSVVARTGPGGVAANTYALTVNLTAGTFDAGPLTFA